MSATCAVHDGRAGNARQALALARALDADAGELVLHPDSLARWLAPRKWPLLSMPFGPGFRAACASPPAVAIGCGRQAALATRLLRERGSKAVQILDPRIGSRHWDIVIAPRHDGLRGENVVSTLGSLHPVDDLWLAQARRQFPALADLPAPRTVLLVGGPGKHAALSDGGFEALLRQLAQRARDEHGSFSAVASRRTPDRWRDLLAKLPSAVPGLRWRDQRDGGNPYAGLLGHADRSRIIPPDVPWTDRARSLNHVLVDGMLRATWWLDGGMLTIQPYGRIPQDEVAAEARRMAEFAGADDVRFEPALP